MNILPIYQFTLGSFDNENLGFVFPTEESYFEGSSVIFAIPKIKNLPFSREYLDLIKVIFPFQLGEEYYNLEGTVYFPKITFNIPRINIEIEFELDHDKVFYWKVFPYRNRFYRKMKYIGENDNLLPENDGFLIISPIDIEKLNNLYLEHNGVFVGLTPKFGDFG